MYDLAQDPHPKQSFLDGVSPKGLSHLPHLKHFALPGLSSTSTEVSAPQVLLLLRGQSHFLNFFCYKLWETHSRGHHTLFFYMNEKESKVNTGRRHKHILESQASCQEMSRGLAPCSPKSFFFF